jgi:superfamily I DNA/RNA helicase
MRANNAGEANRSPLRYYSRVLADESFLKAYERRKRDVQLRDAVDECIQQLATNPRHPGLNVEHLFTSRGVDICSARVNLQFRLIFGWILPREIVLLHVDNHDEAYDWAQRSRERIYRVLERARKWEGRQTSVKPSVLPRLDEDELVPIRGLEALREMLERGMYRYLAALDETQRSYVTFDLHERSGLMFVRAGAGTGKTAIAIHRVLHLAQQPEMGRQGVQYLCFNSVLAETVRGAIRSCNGGVFPTNVSVDTFHSWSGRYLNERNRTVEVTQNENSLAHEVRRTIERLRLRESLKGLEVRDVVFEIGALKRNGHQGVEEYLTSDRSGSRFPLKQGQRAAIWQVFEEVKYSVSGLAEYDDLPSIALDELNRDGAFPGYQAVVVDEAQDCSPVMARLVQAIVLGEPRRLMILADPAQAIYPNGFRLARREFAGGRPHNVVLRTPYRSTRQIYAFAASLYNGIPEHERDISELRDGTRIGPFPEVGIYSAQSETEEALVRAIQDELETETGRKLEEIAVLVCTRLMQERVIEALRSAAIPASVVDARHVDLDFPSVKVITIHSAKGLDFPSVHVFRFEAPHVEPSEARALLYVAITRASFRVNVLCDKDTLSPFLRDLDPQTYALLGTAAGLLAP